jgi:SNF2 family DNA or RNA helicase
MISTLEYTIGCSWLPAGQFLLWAENEHGERLNGNHVKWKMLAWHEKSFYGTAVSVNSAKMEKGAIIGPAMALSYFADPVPVSHLSVQWSEEVAVLRRTAVLLTAAVRNYWFVPDYTKWEKGGWGWRLQLPDDCSSEYAAVAQECSRLKLCSPDLWFDMAMMDLMQSDPDVRAAWERVADTYPMLPREISERAGRSTGDDDRQGTLYQALELNQTRANEEEWHITIGWQKDLCPFRVSLRLVEPDDEAAGQQGHGIGALWSLHMVLEDKERLESPVVCDNYGEPLDGQIPKAWEPFVIEAVSRYTQGWIHALPHLEDTSSPGCLRSRLKEEEAWSFLTEDSLSLMNAGYVVYLPAWWEHAGRTKPKLKLGINSSVGSSGTPLFGLKHIVDFNWKMALGEIELDELEFQHIIEQKRRLLHIRGRWIALDPAMLEQVRRLMKRVDKEGGLSLRDVLEMHLLDNGGTGGSRDTAEDQEAGAADPAGADNDGAAFGPHAIRMEVELNRHLQHLLRHLRETAEIPMIPQPKGLRGSLRKYQLQGASWLVYLRQFGFGACLADDMGLGKTVQWIAYLMHLKEQASALSAPVLLICPTSVIGNWQKELERFAPDMKVHLHYGPNRAKGEDFPVSLQGMDIVITSYTLANLDREELSGICWSCLCLDEAQNIKNAYTKQAAAIRKMPAEHRIALTGTPMENRLTELWSIMEFINPGYLGSLREFTRKFVAPIERTGDSKLVTRVQRWISPFLLRRAKKDPAIQLDLPEKNESKSYVSLTTEQASLYQALTSELIDGIDRLTGMERKGMILAALTRLKQLCNHPGLFLKEKGALRWKNRSNKLARLLEMVREVRDAGERCLIFTQFVETGHLLRTVLEQELRESVQFLHGGVPKAERDRMIERFQSGYTPEANKGPGRVEGVFDDKRQTGPAEGGVRAVESSEGNGIFVLSLKAGGIGLNLTAANHVFHFDRWWNPAVEDQATDRAFRIGQTRDVQVHKFITLGTLEERIDEMIEQKKGLSSQIVGSGEQWITELSADELRELLLMRA